MNFIFDVKDRKGCENVVVDHLLARLENENKKSNLPSVEAFSNEHLH